MTTITKERLLTIKQWRETYGPGSNVVLPAEEAEELARIALASLEAEPVAWKATFTQIDNKYNTFTTMYSDKAEVERWVRLHEIGDFRAEITPLYAAASAPVTPDGWISCSERMPAQDDWILIYSKHGEYMAGQVQGEYVELSDGTLSWLGNALYWMPLPEPPQEVN
ncbi:TPA: DUF551 domain-containing protein [Escherichia coli]|uniref:DUF551 domain-containing protein n=1 Tax=Escherichia coli TaxID=562 RepID=UPI00164FD329|nr:DUF551 domain-containing protein [Escherichia coli]HCN3954835.1 DUF551 domain-containing protein [Escherichia coli]HCO2248424.1 DUF551 domain-containing protein [Escherichia coli]